MVILMFILTTMHYEVIVPCLSLRRISGLLRLPGGSPSRYGQQHGERSSLVTISLREVTCW